MAKLECVREVTRASQTAAASEAAGHNKIVPWSRIASVHNSNVVLTPYIALTSEIGIKPLLLSNSSRTLNFSDL